jgi:hypothetical protein
MTALGAFSPGDVLTAADLNAIGDWQTFTPVFNNVSPTPTTVGRYAVINDLVFYYATLQNTAPTGHLTMNVPYGTANASTIYAPQHTGWVLPTGGTIYHAQGFAQTNQIYWYAYITVATYSSIAAVNATIPDTWTSSGDGYFQGWYALA